MKKIYTTPSIMMYIIRSIKHLMSGSEQTVTVQNEDYDEGNMEDLSREYHVNLWEED